MPTNNQDLHTARVNAADEFYTDYIDIEKEIAPDGVWNTYNFYKKRVFCPCDDWQKSNFYKFFKEHFHDLKLQGLVALSYPSTQYVIYDGHREYVVDNDYIVNADGHIDKEHQDDGDFAGRLSQSIMNNSDVIVTNPPFSLFRKFFTSLLASEKEFLILGNINAVTYREVFPSIVENKVWLGHSIHSGDRKFYIPDEYPLNGTACGTDDNGNRYIRVKGVRWFTNMTYQTQWINYPLTHLTESYNAEKYKRFDDYDAINVNSYKDIPYDYNKQIGCPITIIDKMNEDCIIRLDGPNMLQEYKIVGMLNSGNHPEFYDFKKPIVDKKCKFKRIVIEPILPTSSIE